MDERARSLYTTEAYRPVPDFPATSVVAFPVLEALWGRGLDDFVLGIIAGLRPTCIRAIVGFDWRPRSLVVGRVTIGVNRSQQIEYILQELSVGRVEGVTEVDFYAQLRKRQIELGPLALIGQRASVQAKLDGRRDMEDQLVKLSRWAKDRCGIETNSLIGATSGEYTLVGVVTQELDKRFGLPPAPSEQAESSK